MQISVLSRRLFGALALSAVCLLFAFAQAKSDLTGTWKMNPSKSKFEKGGPEAITIKFVQKDGAISEVLTTTDGNSNERSVEGQYAADGKETDISVGDRSIKGSIKWEGEMLVITWKNGEFAFIRKCKLAADGKSMTVDVFQSSPNGESTDSVYFEKQ